MKTKVIACAVSVFFILGGAIAFHNWDRQGSEIGLTDIEGYSSPEGTRVEKLVIEKHVKRSFDKRLELVSFAPGSGWLKLVTRDQITPVLRFKSVTERDIQEFNEVSESIGYPFRTRLVGKVLYVQHIQNHKEDAAWNTTVAMIDSKTTQERAFFELDSQPRVMMAKDKSGNVRLVKVDTNPDGSKTRIASNMEAK